MPVTDTASIFVRMCRERRLTHGRYGRRRCSDCRVASPLIPRIATVCFAVFSLLIILLDLVRCRVVHCTRLRTPRPVTYPRCLSRRIARALVLRTDPCNVTNQTKRPFIGKFSYSWLVTYWTILIV